MMKRAALVVLVACCAFLNGESSSAPNGQKTGTAECQPTSNFLSDGTLVVQERDCSIRRVSKKDMLKAPDDQTSTSPAQNQSAQAKKLLDIKPEPPPPDDPKLVAKYSETMDAYYGYYTEGYRHRQRVFAWQLISSKVIFVLVTVLVFSGIYFAALQFHEGMRLRAEASAKANAPGTSATGEKKADKPEEPQVTKISASEHGIEVSSPVLGVIILVISLAFFYLYLVYVYPISELF